jgi:type IV secretion system protein VirB11
VRKRASAIFALDDYVQAGIMTVSQQAVIQDMVQAHRNILVIGGTASGKTTLTNGIIKEIVRQYPLERILIAEDTGEIQCAAENSVIYHTTMSITLTHLLKTFLRMRPDRILIGEVRDHAALDLLDAWNTGHEGGVATLHSNDAFSGLSRLCSLVSRNKYAPRVIEPVIGEAIHCIVHIAKTPAGRRVKSILGVTGYRDGQYSTRELAEMPPHHPVTDAPPTSWPM